MLVNVKREPPMNKIPNPVPSDSKKSELEAINTDAPMPVTPNPNNTQAASFWSLLLVRYSWLVIGGLELIGWLNALIANAIIIVQRIVFFIKNYYWAVKEMDVS